MPTQLRGREAPNVRMDVGGPGGTRSLLRSPRQARSLNKLLSSMRSKKGVQMTAAGISG
jgi:hypothetical protein